MTSVLENIWREMPNNITFKADTLEKAIVKLHRLNAAQHNSIDDWHLNMIEATKDLADENQQLAFLEYLSNPMGFKAKHELWDNLEKWQLDNTRKTVQKMVQHTPVDWDTMTEDSKVTCRTPSRCACEITRQRRRFPTVKRRVKESMRAPVAEAREMCT